jgi:hypothetical protein
MRYFILATLLATGPLAAIASGALTPSTVAGNPSAYDGKSVTVTGKVAQYQVSSTPMGKAAGFQLCDSKCIVVVDRTAQSRTDGQTATVTGTFHTTFKGPRRTFNNAIVVGP